MKWLGHCYIHWDHVLFWMDFDLMHSWQLWNSTSPETVHNPPENTLCEKEWTLVVWPEDAASRIPHPTETSYPALSLGIGPGLRGPSLMLLHPMGPSPCPPASPDTPCLLNLSWKISKLLLEEPKIAILATVKMASLKSQITHSLASVNSPCRYCNLFLLPCSIYSIILFGFFYRLLKPVHKTYNTLKNVKVNYEIFHGLPGLLNHRWSKLPKVHWLQSCAFVYSSNMCTFAFSCSLPALNFCPSCIGRLKASQKQALTCFNLHPSWAVRWTKRQKYQMGCKTEIALKILSPFVEQKLCAVR